MNRARRACVEAVVHPRLAVLTLALAASSLAGAARAQDAAPPLTRAELARLRADAVEQLAQGTCVEPAREVRDAITALRRAPPGVVRRALHAYVAAQRDALMRCSLGTGIAMIVPPGPVVPPQPQPPPDGVVLFALADVRVEAPEGRDPTSFMRFLRTHSAEIRWCYEREALQHDPEARGAADLRAVVAADGRIEQLEVVGRPSVPPAVLECVRVRLSRRRVASYQGAEVSGTYAWRMRFQPDDR